jgi:hypothetical protein
MPTSIGIKPEPITIKTATITLPDEVRAKLEAWKTLKGDERDVADIAAASMSFLTSEMESELRERKQSILATVARLMDKDPANIQSIADFLTAQEPSPVEPSPVEQVKP